MKAKLKSIALFTWVKFLDLIGFGDDEPEEEPNVTADQILAGIDNTMTAANLKIDELNSRSTELEEAEEAFIHEIKNESLTPRQKKNSLRQVKRLRERMAAVDSRIGIYNRTIDLQAKMIDKIEDALAASMGKVDDEHLASIMTQFEENMASLEDLDAASDELNLLSLPKPSPREEEELAQLEAEIMGTSQDKPVKREPEVESEPSDIEKKVEEELDKITDSEAIKE